MRFKLPYFLLKTIFFKSSIFFLPGRGTCRHPTKLSEWEGKCILGNNQGNLSPGMATAHQAFIILPKLSKNLCESYLRKGMLAMRQNNPGQGCCLGTCDLDSFLRLIIICTSQTSWHCQLVYQLLFPNGHCQHWDSNAHGLSPCLAFHFR